MANNIHNYAKKLQYNDYVISKGIVWLLFSNMSTIGSKIYYLMPHSNRCTFCIENV